MSDASTAEAARPSTKTEHLIDEALSIVEEFSSEPGISLYFKHCRKLLFRACRTCGVFYSAPIPSIEKDSHLHPDPISPTDGIVLMSAYQASFLFSANGGTGILLRHDKRGNKWSAPCAIGFGGAGIGIQAGLEKKSVIMFLSEKAAMKTLSGEFQLRVGSQITLALGPEGEEDDFYAHFSNRGVASTSSFAHTKGLAFGISFEGSIITPRFKANEEYFGEKVSTKKILYGEVTVPEGSKLGELHQALEAAMVKKVEKKIEYKDTIANPFLNKPYVNKIED
jgi:lipid-binding SYLF domain-containing protein